MNNKKLIKLLTFIMLAGVGSSASAGSYIELQTEEVAIEISENALPSQEETAVGQNNDERFAARETPTQAEPESKIARRMTQAEKNQNAQENDGWGGAITIIAMCIVISALAVLSVLFFIFGKVSEAILTRKKKKAKAAADHEVNEDHHELAPGEVIAAIALALAEHFQEGHDIEDTILTIQRMKKSYSPWNSKIYNLRTLPEHNRTPGKLSAFTKR